MLAIPVPYRWRHVDPWDSVASQPSQLISCRPIRDHVSKNKAVGSSGMIHDDSTSLQMHVHIWAPVSVHTHKHAHTQTQHSHNLQQLFIQFRNLHNLTLAVLCDTTFCIFPSFIPSILAPMVIKKKKPCVLASVIWVLIHVKIVKFFQETLFGSTTVITLLCVH